MTERFFPYDVDRRWLGVLAPLGLRAGHGVTVDVENDRLVATFGWAKVTTSLSNVDHTDITGPHRWYTAVGLRLSFADDGLTMGTNHRLGLCIGFVDPVRRVIGLKDHSALWVSVADPEALAELLSP